MVVAGNKVWLHIAKCGGTYFRGLLAAHGHPGAFAHWKPPTPTEDDLGHLHLNNFHTYLPPGAYHLHTMVRHPAERFYSCWRYVRQRYSGTPRDELGITEEEILGHCASPGELADFLLENPRCLYARACPWLHPQFLYIDDRVEVYRYEERDDWVRLVNEFGMTADVLGNLKISRHQVDSSLESKVSEIYERDCALYGME
jgi:hypothetical protein